MVFPLFLTSSEHEEEWANREVFREGRRILGFTPGFTTTVRDK
jgi:hypothetical protein